MNDASQPGTPVILCLSHVAWDTPPKRLHRMMTRAAETNVVLVWEPAQVSPDEVEPLFRMQRRTENLLVARPTIPAGLGVAQSDAATGELLDRLLDVLGLDVTVAYYTTRVAPTFVGYLEVPVTVADLGDEPGYGGADFPLVPFGAGQV